MASPPALDIQTTIRPGSVYYFNSGTLSHSTDPHFFVVLNKNPATDNIILLVCSSSQVSKVTWKHAMRPETVIEVKGHEYTDFTCDSVFDCNVIFEKSIAELQSLYDANKLRVKSNLSATLLEKLRDAVIASDQVEMEIQDILIL